MFAKNKISQSMIDAVNSVVGETTENVEVQQQLNETPNIKIPTPTGTRVLGGRYGNSAKAHIDQTKREIDTLKGPTTKQLTGKDVKEELKGNQDKIDANHNGKIDGQDFAILRGKKKKMGESYFVTRLLDHAHFAEEVEAELNEVLSKNADAGDWIHDFIHSDNPKFKGKTKAERKKMALGAYYSKQNEGYEGSKEDKEEDAKEAKKRGMSMAKWEKSAEDKKQDKKEMKESNYSMADGPITTDTLAGRVDGGKSDSFKAFKLRVNPTDKEGDGSVREPSCDEPEETTARSSIKARGGEVEVKKGEVVGTFHKEEVELNEDNLDSIAKKHGMEFKRTTYGAGMTHPKHGEVSINRYGEWHHYPAGSKSSKAHGDSSSNFKDLDKHLGTLNEESPKKNQDVADKSWLKDAGKKPSMIRTFKSDVKNLGRFMTGKKETNEEVDLEIEEAEALMEDFELINELSVGAKIRAYANHARDSWEHSDMGNDDESEHHENRAEKIMAHIKKHHGPEAAKHAEKLALSMTFGRDTPHPKGKDSLSGGLRRTSEKPSLTKSGKIPKGTQKSMKNPMWKRKITGPKGHLPEEYELDEKNWIAGAIKKPGAETAAAKRAGMTTHEYMEKHKHDSGKAGKRARLGLTLSKLAKEETVEEAKTLSPGQDDAPFDKPYTTTPKDVKDKSGAIHTPMSRAKDLAHSAMKRVKTEMLGKAPGNN